MTDHLRETIQRHKGLLDKIRDCFSSVCRRHDSRTSHSVNNR